MVGTGDESDGGDDQVGQGVLGLELNQAKEGAEIYAQHDTTDQVESQGKEDAFPGNRHPIVGIVMDSSFLEFILL